LDYHGAGETYPPILQADDVKFQIVDPGGNPLTGVLSLGIDTDASWRIVADDQGGFFCIATSHASRWHPEPGLVSVTYFNQSGSFTSSETLISGQMDSVVGVTNSSGDQIFLGQFLDSISGDGSGSSIVAFLQPPDVAWSGTDSGEGYGSYGGSDLLWGNGGRDFLNSGSGDDSIYGGLGDDFLFGGQGADLMNGGLGNDFYVIDDAGDVIEGEVGYSLGGGIDTVRSFIDYTAPVNIEIVRLGNLLDTTPLNATGNDAPGTLVGNAGANTLNGRGGNDQINGNAGNDTLIGGEGRDTLVGGAGADTFVFSSISNSRAGAATRDVINGFTRAPGDQDIIDLSAIDANTLTAGVNDAFAFIGTGAFTAAGQLRLVGLGGADAVIVAGDVTGDGVADFQIFVNLQTTMVAGDFVL